MIHGDIMHSANAQGSSAWTTPTSALRPEDLKLPSDIYSRYGLMTSMLPLFSDAGTVLGPMFG